MIIKQGDPLYDLLYKMWRRDKPGTVRHGGKVYEVVNDNEVISFAVQGNDDPFGYYGQQSMRQRG